MTSDAVHHLLQFYPLCLLLLIYLPSLFAVDLGDFVAVGILVKKLDKGCEQAGNGGCNHGMVTVRIINLPHVFPDYNLPFSPVPLLPRRAFPALFEPADRQRQGFRLPAESYF